MAEQTFKIEFDGYWRDQNKGSVPSKSGVYCVYECTHNKNKKTVTLNKLIYIGEAGNVRDRIDGHEKYSDWKKHVRVGKELCFSFGSIGSTYRDRCEAAVIFKHKPPENGEFKNSFPFDKTTMNLSGEIALLTSTFTANRT
jgi:excinuclease UvrABC nuclease subunit